MLPIFRSGRYLFAVAVIAFGVIQLVTGNFLTGLFPFPETLPARKFFLYFFSTFFVLCGAGMSGDKFGRPAALGAGKIFFLLMIFPHVVKLLQDVHNPGPWTGLAETAGLCGGAFMLAETLLNLIPENKETAFTRFQMRAGRYIFAGGLLIVAAQHFMYAGYISTLIPGWIPFPLFWSYLVGVAFLAAGASLLIQMKMRLVATLLGFMFLFWVVFLHAPRVAASPRTEPEWSSLFVAVAFCGAFFVVAGDVLRYGVRE
jgi:uncharacterized membrane protein